MPWCETCSRFWNPNSMPEDGTCPSCGVQLADPQETAAEQKTKIPWHFWVMVVAVAGYLGWRLIEGVIWLVEQISG